MRNTKLFLSLLLSLSIGLMPTVALADGETQVSEEEIIEETASSEMSEEADSEEEEEDTPGENSYDYGPNRDYTSETVKRVPLLYLADGSAADAAGTLELRCKEELYLDLDYTKICSSSDIESIAWAVHDDGNSYSIIGLEFSNEYTYDGEYAGVFPYTQITPTDTGLFLIPAKCWDYHITVAINCTDGFTYLDTVTLVNEPAAETVYEELSGILSFSNSPEILAAEKQRIRKVALEDEQSPEEFEEWWQEYIKDGIDLIIPVGETVHLNVDFKKAGGKENLLSVEFVNACDCEEEPFDPAGSNPYYTMTPDETGYNITGKSIHSGQLTIKIKRDGASGVTDTINLKIVPKDYVDKINTDTNKKPSTVQTSDTSALILYEITALISAVAIGLLSTSIITKKYMK